MERWDSYVALGDSFTEGLADAVPDGGFRGWADRLAEHLAGTEPDLRYANLAVRGKLLHQIVEDQVPRALELLADREALAEMSRRLEALARPDAAERIVDEIVRAMA